MRAKNTFTIHTELIDGTLSGARNIYMGANSTCHLYVILENFADLVRWQLQKVAPHIGAVA